MNLKLISALAAVGLMSAAPAFAESVTLDFEGTSGFLPIDQYYNGGGGPNYGISFGLDLMAMTNDPSAPVFSNAPSPETVMAVFGTGSTAVNFGYDARGTFSFGYSLSENASIEFWSGANGTGTLLDTIELTANATNGCSDTAYCFWSTASLTLDSAVRSIQFADAFGKGGFDNLSAPAVPLPAAGWLLMSALGGIGAWSRRKRDAA